MTETKVLRQLNRLWQQPIREACPLLILQLNLLLIIHTSFIGVSCLVVILMRVLVSRNLLRRDHDFFLNRSLLTCSLYISIRETWLTWERRSVNNCLSKYHDNKLREYLFVFKANILSCILSCIYRRPTHLRSKPSLQPFLMMIKDRNCLLLRQLVMNFTRTSTGLKGKFQRPRLKLQN